MPSQERVPQYPEAFTDEDSTTTTAVPTPAGYSPKIPSKDYGNADVSSGTDVISKKGGLQKTVQDVQVTNDYFSRDAPRTPYQVQSRTPSMLEMHYERKLVKEEVAYQERKKLFEDAIERAEGVPHGEEFPEPEESDYHSIYTWRVGPLPTTDDYVLVYQLKMRLEREERAYTEWRRAFQQIFEKDKAALEA